MGYSNRTKVRFPGVPKPEPVLRTLIARGTQLASIAESAFDRDLQRRCNPVGTAYRVTRSISTDAPNGNAATAIVVRAG